MAFYEKILSILLPKKCTFCRKVISYTDKTCICPDCRENLPYIKGAVCAKCSSPRHEGSMPVCSTCRTYRHPFSGSFTPLLYEGSARKAILNLKFHNKEQFCRSFAFLIADKVLKKGFPHIDFITYIPLSPKGLRARGYNQSELIASECGKILNLPVISTLRRINGTPKQSSLSFSERRKNPKKSFFGKDIRLSGTALLIDDIYTTGSTLSHTASLLLKMGCDKVYIATVALKSKK